MDKLTNEQVIELIDYLSGDEFCEELALTTFSDYSPSPERMKKLLDAASDKLSTIYQIAHSHNTQPSCYSVHNSWREGSRRRYVAMQNERAPR
jgi:hypothetical protein